jgi:hypothetical protein
VAANLRSPESYDEGVYISHREIVQFASEGETDLVIRTCSHELFKVNIMILTDCDLISIKPEFEFLLDNVLQLTLRMNCPTHPRQLASQIQVLNEYQIGPSLYGFDLDFILARPDEHKESYDLAKILESLGHTHVKRLEAKTAASDFVLDDFNVETFREFQTWNRGLLIFSLFGFRINALGSRSFSHFRGLMMLLLQNLGIREIGADAFKGFKSLRVLNLADNRSESFESGTFNCLPKLAELYLDGNKLENLQPGLFECLNELERLHLDETRLSVDSSEDTFSGLANLRLIHLRKTPLGQVINEESQIIRKHMKKVKVDI